MRTSWRLKSCTTRSVAQHLLHGKNNKLLPYPLIARGGPSVTGEFPSQMADDADRVSVS